jgi:hypothetical protein
VNSAFTRVFRRAVRAHHRVAALPLAPLASAANPGHQFLRLGQDARDDGVDARRGRMQAIALIELPIGGDAVEEEGIEQDAILASQVGIDRLEGAAVIRAEIGRCPHAGEEDSDPPRGQPAHDLGQRDARHLGVDAPQHVVGAELEDHGVGTLRHRPVKTGKAAGGGVAGDPGIADLNRQALGAQRLLQPNGKSGIGRQTVPGGERIAERHYPDRLFSRGRGTRGGQPQRQREQNCRLDPRHPTPI